MKSAKQERFVPHSQKSEKSDRNERTPRQRYNDNKPNGARKNFRDNKNKHTPEKF